MLKSFLAFFRRSSDSLAKSSAVCEGTWILNNVGGQVPPLALHIIRVAPNDTWKSESLLVHKGGGYTEVSGGGEWKIRDGTLQYTAGDNSGRTGIQLIDDRMILAKDPMLQLTDYVDTTCIYVRTSEQETARIRDELIAFAEQRTRAVEAANKKS